MKGKPLLPTLRTKKRYVLYKAVSESPLRRSEIVDAIKESFKTNFGLFSLGKAGLMDVRLYDNKKQIGILKINHVYVDHLNASMATIEKINNKRVILNTTPSSAVITRRYPKDCCNPMRTWACFIPLR